MSEFEQQGRTDHLEAILEAIFSNRQTGILHVERGKGGVRDGGDIIILHGQVIDASSGSRQGAEALEWLLTWGNCQYNFQVKFPNEVVAPPGAAAGATLPITSPPSAPSAPITAPLKFPGELAAQNIFHFFTSGAEKEDPVSATDSGGYNPLPDRFSPVTQENWSRENGRFRIEEYPLQIPQSLPDVRAPERMQNGSEALALLERFRLTRLHRHVFLLLDGKRTIYDLVRLTGRSLNEVDRLLVDLERIGLIRLNRH